MLREDNADLRLTETGRKLGLVDDDRWQAFCEHREEVELLQQQLRDQWARPDNSAGQKLKPKLQKPLNHEYRFSELLKRPELGIDDLLPLMESASHFTFRASEQVEINTKYAGYLQRQQDEINKAAHNEDLPLPLDLDYAQVKGLSNEVLQKLADIRPATVGQAGRISGVTPAAISLLLVHLKKISHPQSRSA